MTVDDQITARARVAGPAHAVRGLARRALWRLAPAYARRRSRKAALAATVQRLQADFEHVSKRHGEQIERLEDLARELVSTAESLRREIAQRERRDGD
jgi:seryl-tRNA synthetase